jgi:hypothetical protein
VGYFQVAWFLAEGVVFGRLVNILQQAFFPLVDLRERLEQALSYWLSRWQGPVPVELAHGVVFVSIDTLEEAWVCHSALQIFKHINNIASV